MGRTEPAVEEIATSPCSPVRTINRRKRGKAAQNKLISYGAIRLQP